ncbi:hypothetical protein NM208_g15687 [Fusarium decemcellulare]|uniref:Uncharacterized protein n=1 Tax=Fusarium decemcellulare TaxID=57161 RepID=A0ACC1RCF9_9HYPO|nr:hypothetical protein NM208_g15687 [Fusarium decemcellulare]
MNTLRCMRPVAARVPFQRSTLPRIARAYSSQTYEYIQVSQPKPGVGQVTLNRPKALNALCTPLIKELNQALLEFNASSETSVIILTGSQKAFAAGADIKEMAPLTFADAYTNAFIESCWP